jgi:hypothetical protein
MAYTRVNWVNTPSTTTPINDVNLNDMDAYIATLDTTCLRADGSVVMSAALKLALALGGANKVVAEWNATDGKKYQLIITTTNKLVVWNATDSVNCIELGPAAGQVTANSNPLIPQIGGAAWAGSLAFGIGPIGSRPAPGTKGRVYLETSFS